ncbi:hypothetical protein [Campylobacter jejuni]|uniref:Uncharacterized protein n=1 Tax=Campylobacter jejuni TaxID=197 RepID=A0A431EB34_CAMJU|nr:hypothetical protein [Campylobacter jejuni]RTJ78331.1 hypothetical protein C3H57_08475 [Campylobacter jejuni]
MTIKDFLVETETEITFICKVCNEKISQEKEGFYNRRLGFKIREHLSSYHGMSEKDYFCGYIQELAFCQKCGKDITSKFISLFKGFPNFCSKSCHSSSNIGKIVKSPEWRAKILEVLAVRNKSEEQRRIASSTMKRTMAKLWKSESFRNIRSKASRESCKKQWKTNSSFKEIALSKLMRAFPVKSSTIYKGVEFTYRSSLEYSFSRYLIDNNLNFHYETCRIQYEFEGSTHFYYIDYVVEVGEDLYYIEIKPSIRIFDPVNLKKFQTASRKFGDKFLVITEKELFTEGIQFLDLISSTTIESITNQ